jgi:hypothetical protein
MRDRGFRRAFLALTRAAHPAARAAIGKQDVAVQRKRLKLALRLRRVGLLTRGRVDLRKENHKAVVELKRVAIERTRHAARLATLKLAELRAAGGEQQ